jgi:hypothetical protein
MKKMQNFREWLSSTDMAPTPLQRRLTTLTRLDRAQLAGASNGLAWFIWEAAETASA